MSRARPVLLALLAGLLLAVGVSACGGERVAADEVAAPPPELTIPSGDADALAGDDGGASTTGTDTTSTTESGDDDAAGDPGAADPGAAAAPAPAATATPAPPAATPPQDSAENDAPPPAGSGAQKFEEFCEQNAGAC